MKLCNLLTIIIYKSVHNSIMAKHHQCHYLQLVYHDTYKNVTCRGEPTTHTKPLNPVLWVWGMLLYIFFTKLLMNRLNKAGPVIHYNCVCLSVCTDPFILCFNELIPGKGRHLIKAFSIYKVKGHLVYI